jgi:two-component system, chemotaxis family, sensor histidine kinase and response regulator PixL
MIDPDLRDRVYQMFVVEVPGMLETIETELVTLGLDRTATKIHNLLRAAHSIKGCAASLGLEAIRDLAHQIEAIFRILNHPELPFDRSLEELLFQLYDCLFQLISAEINRVPLSPDIDIKTKIVLAKLDESIGHFVIAGASIPHNLSLGIDITRSIFEVDVAPSLSRLAGILADPGATSTVVGEFRAQADVFTGIAELVGLPGFSQIAHATIAALDRHPHRANEICCFALADFYRGLEAVLAGDRVSGGNISAEFAELMVSAPQSTIREPEDRFDLVDIFEGELSLDIIDVDARLAIGDSFDLADIFEGELSVDIIDGDEFAPIALARIEDDLDLLFEEMILAPKIAILLPEISTERDLNFDLVDIFEQFATCSLMDRSTAIHELVATITTDFDNLPPLSQSDLIRAGIGAPPKTIQPTKIKKSRKASIPKPSQLSVRVSVDRLDRMNNLVGELAIERHGLALYNQQLNETVRALRTKCEEFQRIGDQMRQIADKISMSNRSILSPKKADIYPINNNFNDQFDPLELDRYGQLHGIAQETLEQLAQIEEKIEDLTLFSTQSDRQIDRQKQLLSHLRDDLRWSRMLPLGEILNRFPRTLHDLSIEYQKPCDLKITGAGVLVDKAAIEKLLDPLVHLLRNAFDHGIDPPEIRNQQGKPERGLIEINAYHQGSQTVIEVRDDGRGIDISRVKAKAISLGLIDIADAATPNIISGQSSVENPIFGLLFYPGFSTTDRVTALSGRGMGLDIVKEQIQAIKGKISVQSEWGEGTTFTLTIPLTLTIAQLMICQAGKAFYAFPADSIQRIVVPTPQQIKQQDRQRQLHWHHLTIPIYNLADILAYSNPLPERSISQTIKTAVNHPTDWLAPILLIRTGDRVVGLEIDQVISEQELTIKPFGKAITPPSYSYGCTILGDGSILPVLDAHTLIRALIDSPQGRLRQRPNCRLPQPSRTALEPINLSKLILVADDSVTSRQSLCLTLEKYGYRTLQAKDGQVALQLLREQQSEIKLVICDVEMPNLNGFEFLNIRRLDPNLAHIPVAMLTSRSNQKHRQFATHLGAIEYFVKPYLETDFMAAIGKILMSK